LFLLRSGLLPSEDAAELRFETGQELVVAGGPDSFAIGVSRLD
jgi:hypothetical protein